MFSFFTSVEFTFSDLNALAYNDNGHYLHIENKLLEKQDPAM